MSSTILIFFTVILTIFVGLNQGQEHEGDPCVFKKNNEPGICKPLPKCTEAVDLLKLRINPQNCGFHVLTPIVCCPLGRKSYQKCLEYSGYKPKSDDDGDPRPFLGIAGGIKSLVKEFPHMALLGWGEKDNVQWQCGGSLISEKFVLTAAHCLYSREYGEVKYVRLGDLDIESTNDDAQPEDFDIVRVIPYPEYNNKYAYHDIALVELSRKVQFSDYIRPACLHSENTVPKTNLTITGWGLEAFLGERSSFLLKATINMVSQKICSQIYRPDDPKIPKGLLEETQFCAGNEGKDTCPGDSGGPLQIRNIEKDKKIAYFSIVGITSFGKGCGFKDIAGVYTKVAPYVKWIEDIVWK